MWHYVQSTPIWQRLLILTMFVLGALSLVVGNWLVAIAMMFSLFGQIAAVIGSVRRTRVGHGQET